jgi:hypothetical protein
MPVLPQPIKHASILVEVVNGIDLGVGAKIQRTSIIHFDSPKSFVFFPSPLSFPNIHSTLIESLYSRDIA